MESRYRYLGGSIRHVSAHVSGTAATAADGGRAQEHAQSVGDAQRQQAHGAPLEALYGSGRLSRLLRGKGDSDLIESGNVTPASDVNLFDSRYRNLGDSIRHVIAHLAGPTATAADGGQHKSTRRLSGMHNDSKHMVRFSRLFRVEGDSHFRVAGNVTSSIDASWLELRYRYLGGSIRHVSAHVAGPAATPADGGRAQEHAQSIGDAQR